MPPTRKLRIDRHRKKCRRTYLLQKQKNLHRKRKADSSFQNPVEVLDGCLSTHDTKRPCHDTNAMQYVEDNPCSKISDTDDNKNQWDTHVTVQNSEPNKPIISGTDDMKQQCQSDDITQGVTDKDRQ